MKSVIEKFYKAFSNLDADEMVACYHKDIIFEDPAFGVLRGEKAGNMWRMLCESQKGKNFQIEFREIGYENGIGMAHWEAHYTFSRTGRKIHNKIDARFRFKDGKIIEHTDHFKLYLWSRQALGFIGYLIGWTSYFKNKLNKQTNKILANWEKINLTSEMEGS